MNRSYWLIAAAASSLLGLAPARAADLPAQTMPAYAPAPVSAFSWTGFYFGLNAGAAFSKDHSRFEALNFPEIVTIYEPRNDNDTGFTGGAQIGFNWQFGALVAGVEADINYIDRGRDRVNVSGGVGLPYAVVNGDRQEDWYGTARARLGLALDRTLVYATGGFAFADNDGRQSIEFFNAAPPGAPLNCLTGCTFVSRDDSSNVGWALGAGLEFAVTDSMSLKVEYLHIDFGTDNRTYRFGSAAQQFTSREENRFDVVRAGVNFRF